MQGLRRCSNDVVFHLNLTSPNTDDSPTDEITTNNHHHLTTNNHHHLINGNNSSSSLSIDEDESTEAKIQRLIAEHPVIIFSKSSCCMCHVMKNLLATIGVHPTVIELDDHEIPSLTSLESNPQIDGLAGRNPNPAPSVFIGGSCVGGLESLVALHLSGNLVPKLVEVGALWV